MLSLWPSVYVCKNRSEKKRNCSGMAGLKDKGQINRVNVKHVLGDLSCAAEGTKVAVKFGSRRDPFPLVALER